jgi:hypothetical protein
MADRGFINEPPEIVVMMNIRLRHQEDVDAVALIGEGPVREWG